MTFMVQFTVGTLYGLLLAAVAAQNVRRLVEINRLRGELQKSNDAAKILARDAAAAEQNLVEAREVFKEQLHRPAQAYFNDAQVETLAQMLTKLLFKPVTELVHKERDTDEHIS